MTPLELAQAAYPSTAWIGSSLTADGKIGPLDVQVSACAGELLGVLISWRDAELVSADTPDVPALRSAVAHAALELVNAGETAFDAAIVGVF